MSPISTTRYAPPATLTETRVKTLNWRGCVATIAALHPTGPRVRALRPRGQPLFWDVSPILSPSFGGIRSASRLNTARAATIWVRSCELFAPAHVLQIDSAICVLPDWGSGSPFPKRKCTKSSGIFTALFHHIHLQSSVY